MLTLQLTGTNLEIAASMVAFDPDLGHILERVNLGMTKRYLKREIMPYEAACLYALARQFDRPGAEFFEIGTCYGWSALVMAAGAPHAHIATCTPNPSHIEAATANFAGHPNLELRPARSQDLLTDYRGPLLDMLFIDGDHNAVIHDMPWWNWLKVGGLMVHHDYCPADAPIRPCRPVYDCLNEWAAKTHPFDVLIVNHEQAGLAGWYRREGEVWPTKI
jgi:predicted O-methyltransferase YrrM